MTTTSRDERPLAQVAFEAYGNHPGPHGPWLTFDGRVMPAWVDLGGSATGTLTRERWDVAVREAIAEHERRKSMHEKLQACVSEAQAEVVLARGRASGREWALVVTKAEEAQLWLQRALAIAERTAEASS